MVHELKTWPEYFESVRLGEKRFEIRRDDRNFKEGDILVLQEYNNSTKLYTGREIICTVTYVLRDMEFGVKDGFCIMSIIVI